MTKKTKSKRSSTLNPFHPPVPQTPNQGVAYKTVKMPPVHPDMAKLAMSTRKPAAVWQPPAAFSKASNTVQGAPSIVEMARALKNDPQLMYEFVYNNIEHQIGMGLAKGALGTLLDGVGNSFDLSSLLAALLREAGFDAYYEVGQIQLTFAQVADWLGITDTNISTAVTLIANAGVPVSLVGTAPDQEILMSHCWLKVNIGTAMSPDWVVMDPSFKTYTTKSAIDLATAMSYSASSFLSDARSGYTIDGSGNWVKDLNRTNVRNNLTTLSMNLADWIKTNNPGARTDDIIGGRQIVPVTLPVTFATDLPYQAVGDTPVEFTGDFSTAYKVSVRFVYYGIDETLTSDQLCGHRLTLFFVWTGSGWDPTLALDGVTVATGTPVGSLFNYYLQVIVTHNAYPTTGSDQSFYLFTEGPVIPGSDFAKVSYLIGSSFGPSGKGLFEYHNDRQMKAEFANGSTGPYEVAEPLLGERMAAQWASFASQATMVSDILSTMSGTDFTNHHLVGLVTYRLQNSNRYFSGFDIQGWVRSLTGIDGSNSDTAAAGIVDGMHRYAIEMLAIQQQTMPVTGTTVGSQGVSTTRLIDVASLNGEKLFKGTSSNWSTVTPQLTGYSSGDLNFLNTTYLMNGLDVLLPQNYGTPFGTPWTLRGWSIIDPAGSAAGTILGAYAGGLCFGWWPARKRKKKRPCVDDFSVNPQNGDFQMTPPPDITIGSGGEPYLIPIFRPYNSGEAGEGTAPGPMGNGWNFNWNAEAEVGAGAPYSDGYLALGSESPINAVASISQMFVAMDLLSDTSLPVDKLVIAHLTDQWWVDNLTNNIVTVRMPGDEDLVFTKLPDGTFQPPQGNASTLTGMFSFTMTTPQQVQYEFAAGSQNKKLYSITQPNGVTTTVNYMGSKITSVDNGMGRALNFNYTGDQVTSIDDGNGRSVSYSYDVDGNLTQFTDLMGQAHTYEYDSPGRMTKYFKPQNPTDAVITNTYDSLSRVQSQVDIMGHDHTYYIAGPRSEIVDPVGNSKVRYYDSNDNEVKRIDALGNVTTSEFDGLGRLVKQVEPEGNYTTWEYDLNNNILTEARVPKPGSSLLTIYNYWAYDLTWNKPYAVTDGRLLTTYFTYDALTGDLLKIERPPIGLDTPTVEMTYNSRGQILTKTDETGIITSYTYDTGTEVLLSVVHDFGTSPHLNLTTNFGYDVAGNLTSVEDPLGRTSVFVYDDLRRIVTREETSPFNYQTHFEYDQNSNLTLVKRETGDIANPWQEFSFTYSLSDKKLTAEEPGGATSYRFYDSADRMYKTEDAEGREYIYSFDELNRVVEVLDPTAVTSEIRSYSANGKLVSIEDARGNITSYTFDGFDRLEETAYPDSTTERIEFYDEDNNVWTFRNRAGDPIYRTYDVLNRIETKTAGFITTTYTYDLAGRLLTAAKPVISGDPSTGTFEQQWDSAGRFVKEIYPDAKEVAFELDANGNVTKITYPDGYYVERVYDELNRLTDIKLNGDTASAASFTYDPLSRRTSMTYSSGASVAYDWQLNNDLSAMTNSSGSGLIQTYGYNNVHQMTSQTFSDDRFSWHPGAAGTVSYDTASDTNQYPAVDSVSFTYNANGCLTSDGVASYAYDDENHMIAAYAAGLTFSYDPFHRQSAKFSFAANTRYLYSGWQRVADYDNDTDTLLNRYVYGTGLDEPLIEVSPAGTLKFLHANHQASILATSDDTGTMMDWNSYSPFGENFTVYGTTFGYTGQRFDVESSLYYFKRRYYDPKLGRFLQPDPIGYNLELACGCGCACAAGASPTNLNLYSYVANDPVNLLDPIGLNPATLSPPERPNTQYTPGSLPPSALRALISRLGGAAPWILAGAVSITTLVEFAKRSIRLQKEIECDNILEEAKKKCRETCEIEKQGNKEAERIELSREGGEYPHLRDVLEASQRRSQRNLDAENRRDKCIKDKEWEFIECMIEAGNQEVIHAVLNM